jgi:hypothetical protein
VGRRDGKWAPNLGPKIPERDSLAAAAACLATRLI